MGRLIRTEKKKSDTPKIKAPGINKELYQGEIPSIVGLTVCVVRHPDKEMLIFVKNKHINRARKKYGRSFLRVCGTVISDPKKVLPRKRTVNLGEIDDYDEFDEIIIQESRKRISKPVIESEVDDDYDPYADVRPDEDDELEEEQGLNPKKRVREPRQPPKIIVKAISIPVLTRLQYNVMELWKQGLKQVQIASKLHHTSSKIGGAQNLIFRKLGGDLYPDFKKEFEAILSTLEYQVETELETEILSEPDVSTDEPSFTETCDAQNQTITFTDFIKEYGSNRDLIQAEKIFNSMPEHDKALVMEYLPSYNASISNPMYKKSPVAYLTERKWRPLLSQV